MSLSGTLIRFFYENTVVFLYYKYLKEMTGVHKVIFHFDLDFEIIVP
jgi:hypothetical protein